MYGNEESDQVFARIWLYKHHLIFNQLTDHDVSGIMLHFKFLEISLCIVPFKIWGFLQNVCLLLEFHILLCVPKGSHHQCVLSLQQTFTQRFMYSELSAYLLDTIAGDLQQPPVLCYMTKMSLKFTPIYQVDGLPISPLYKCG